jgi:drug/metabolite transporter (DMT)-like permease
LFRDYFVLLLRLLFHEDVFMQWFAGAGLVIVGVFILSKSSIEEKQNSN